MEREIFFPLKAWTGNVGARYGPECSTRAMIRYPLRCGTASRTPSLLTRVPAH